MSIRYQEMWDSAKELSPPELEEWINALKPVKGIYVTFKGRRFIDIDLVEALEYLLKESEQKQSSSERR